MTVDAAGWFDADSHVIEPPWIWPDYTAGRFGDRIPRLSRRGDQEWLVLDGRDLFPLGRIGGLRRGASGIPLSDADMAGGWDDNVVPGGYDIAARLAAMDCDGVGQALVFPTIAMSFYAVADRDLRWALLSAYNRWVADLCSSSGGRLLCVCMVDPSDSERSAAEIASARERGHSAVLVPLWSDAEWSYANPEFDRLWVRAAADSLPVGFHAFASRSPHLTMRGLPLAVDSVSARPAVVTAALAKLVFGGVFERIPNLRWFSAENDAGWCPYFLERGETLYRRAGAELPISRPPTDVFRDHVFVTFTNEQVVIDNAEMIGAGNLMWGSDYPHNVTSWPQSHEFIGAMFRAAATPPALQHLLVRANAERIFT